MPMKPFLFALLPSCSFAVQSEVTAKRTAGARSHGPTSIGLTSKGDLIRVSASRAARPKVPAEAAELTEEKRQLTNTAHDFLQTLRLCSPCTRFEQFGEDNNDGNSMCTDGLGKGIKAAFSIGIDSHDNWADVISSRYQIPVHEFDCGTSAPSRPHCKTCNVSFHQQCLLHDNGKATAAADHMRKMALNHAPKNPAVIRTVNASAFKTLTEMLQETGYAHAKPHSLLLKMDIQGAEWKFFSEESVHNIRKFKQLVVGFHNVHKVENHPMYLAAVKKLEEAGFAVAHLHGRTAAQKVEVFGENSEYRIPENIEVTYLKKPKHGCASNIPNKSQADLESEAAAADMLEPVLPDSPEKEAEQWKSNHPILASIPFVTLVGAIAVACWKVPTMFKETKPVEAAPKPVNSLEFLQRIAAH